MENTQEPVLMPFQSEAFNGDNHICEQFLEFKKSHSINHVIETGSCLYSTTEWLADNFEKVSTVEINPEFARFGIHKVKDKPNCYTYMDDSVNFLKTIVPALDSDEKCLWWLDAHWNNHCPLLEELAVIATTKTKHPPVIAIHDFYTGNPELGYDSYNGQDFTYEWIEPMVKLLEQNLGVTYKHKYNEVAEGAKRGIIYLYV